MRAVIMNLTKHAITLRSASGDATQVPPSLKPVKVQKEYIDWQTPNPAEIRVLYLLDDNDNRVVYEPPAAPVAEDDDDDNDNNNKNE